MCKRMKKNSHKALHVRFDRQGGKCFYCGRQTFIDCSGDPRIKYFPDQATREHLIPQCELRDVPNRNVLMNGVGRQIDNVVMSCQDCNNKKGDQSLYEFLSPRFLAPIAEGEEVQEQNQGSGQWESARGLLMRLGHAYERNPGVRPLFSHGYLSV